MKYFAGILLFFSTAWAQSIDSHRFVFSDTLETVGLEDALGTSSEFVQSRNPFLFNASMDYARDSLSATNLASNPISIVDHLYSVSLGAAALIHPRILVGVSGSLHYVDLSDDYVSDQFDRMAWKFGDVNVHAKIRLTGDASKINVAFRPFMEIPTGSTRYLTSNESFRYGGRVLMDTIVARWKLYFYTGISYASNATFLNLNEKTLFDTGLGVFFSINSQFGINAEWLQSISMQDTKSGQNPTQVNLGIRYDAGTTKVFVGGGVQGFDFSNDYRPFVFYAGIKQPFGVKRSSQQIIETNSAPIVEQAPSSVSFDPAFDQAVESVNASVVYFDTNSARIKPEYQNVLDQAVNFVQQYGEKTKYVVVYGHADPRGNASYNKRLSERRAQSVKKYFIAHGVDEHAVLIDGYGATVPKTTDRKNYQMDRRVEFYVVKK